MLISDIEKQIDSGKTLYISTCLKTIKITPATLNKWRSANIPLFKDGDSTGFYIARGRHYDFIIERVCDIRFAI